MKIIRYGLIPLTATHLLTVPGTLAANGAGFALEEVVVTARKREESLQDAPVAVSAYTSNELKVRNIQSTDQLADITPNLTFDANAPASGSNASSQIFIRGMGQTDFTAVTDPGAGLYVDGVYYARSIGGALDFLDLERIEILRGPQGTLFGRNLNSEWYLTTGLSAYDTSAAYTEGVFSRETQWSLFAKYNF